MDMGIFLKDGEDFLFSMATFSNSNVEGAVPAAGAPPPQPGTLVPRPAGMAGGRRGFENIKSGDYAMAARAFMREGGMSAYKLRTPGNMKVKAVLEQLCKDYEGAGFVSDAKIIRLMRGLCPLPFY